MLISWRWLNEYLDLGGTDIETVAERLTMTGCEVESIETPCELLSGILIARIEKLYPHPKAEKLFVAEVMASTGRFTCVTAAPNLAQGHLVPYAPPGSCLSDGTVLEAKEFSGIVSEGMLLSAEEIGLPDIADEFGILILPEDTPLAEDFKSYFGLDDMVMDISITPNRGDLLSILGLAREVHALFPASEIKALDQELNGDSGDWPVHFAHIKLEDEGCTTYSLAFADEIRIGPSPLKQRIRLSLMGMRPISNVVDATNIAMLLTGQPLHAFDLSMLPAKSIEVRSAKKGERFITLDEKEHVLSEGDMLITSGNIPVGIGGVMGGQNSEINEETSQVVIESAHFLAPRVSKTSRRLGIHSEAAYRFARGVDRAKTDPSLDHVLRLISEWSNARCFKKKMTVKGKTSTKTSITLRVSSLKKVLLWDDLSEAAKILERLGFEITSINDVALEAVVPSWRPDIAIEEDLIEEVGRIRGYDLIKPRLPGKLHIGGNEGALYSTQRKVRQVALSRGYTEAVTYSFISPEFRTQMNLAKDDLRSHPLQLSNPISQQMVCMRTSMLPGLLNALSNSIKTGWRQEIKVFEMGRIFLLTESDKTESLREVETIAGLVFPGLDRRTPYPQALEEDFFSVKGDVTAILRSCELAPMFERTEESFGHSGQTAAIIINCRCIGKLLRLKPSLEADLEIEGPVFYFEIELDQLMENRSPLFRDISQYPAVYRDISLLVESGIESEEICNIIREMAGSLLWKVRLFDIYQGKGIPEGYRSLAFSLAYRCEDRTLNDQEVEKVHENVRDQLVKKGFQLR